MNKKFPITRVLMILLSVISITSTFCFTHASAMPSASADKKISIPFNWQIWRTNDAMQINSRRLTNNGLIEIRAQLTVQSSIAGFINFIQDEDNVKSWLDNVDACHVDKVNTNESILTVKFNAIWPISKRIMKVYSRIEQQTDLSVIISVKDLGETIGDNSDYLPVSVNQAQWKITPVSVNEIQIVYQFIANANGNLPHWLANKMMLTSTWKTLNNIYQQLPNSRYQQLTHPDIKEYKKDAK